MADHRAFLLPGSRRDGASVVLDERESHHLLRVRRAREGASVEALDGAGTILRTRLDKVGGKRAHLAVTAEERRARNGPERVLAAAVLKGKAMDWLLRLATEIGVERIQPIMADRCAARLAPGRPEAKRAKWETTMIEACKQCGVPFLPALERPIGAAEWLERDAPGGGDAAVVASLESQARPLADALREAAAAPQLARVIAATGPEGDFSPEEYAAMRDAGFRPVRLGANVLRAETAAAYILSVIDQTVVEGRRA